jgi:hypothetical protein
MKRTIIALTLAVTAVFAPFAGANQNGASVSEQGTGKTFSPYDRDSAAASPAE